MQTSWSLDRIKAPLAWPHSTGEGAVVAVLDTGLDVAHPDLQDHLWTNPGEVPANGRDDDGNGFVDDVHGIDALTGDGHLADTGEHGTHVAGIVRQVAPGAKIMGIRIFDRNGRTDLEGVLRALRYAGQMGATIVNCSWGGCPYTPALYEAMRDCPALLVCSAGNTGSDSDQVPHFPSGFELPNLLSVAATNRNDGLCFTSCHSDASLGAPGEQIPSTVPGGGWKVKSGSSQAAPHVSGAAALLGPLPPRELKARLLKGADPVNDPRIPLGRLNAGKSVHGPHLLRDFYRDFERSWQDARSVDNTPEDLDPRPDRVDLGAEQAILGPGRLAIRSDDGLLVWLEGRREGDRLSMRQAGWARDAQGCYSYPLVLEGPPDTPFDPPEAQRVSVTEYEQACAQYEAQWYTSPMVG